MRKLEELLFRGVIFTRLKRFLPVVTSALLSALLFGILVCILSLASQLLSPWLEICMLLKGKCIR